MLTHYDLRIGHGYDLHRLDAPAPGGPGKPLLLAGVELDHELGVVAHSDGDTLYHAVTDALLGALALPDIGELFPDSDPRHESASSSIFLDEAMKRVREEGFAPVNIDCTILLERPRVSPYKDELRENIAARLDLPLDAVNVKGKSREGLDGVGEGRAVEVHCVVLLVRQGESVVG
jgi:2-C-methyl-D-erythritol 2,4-cyclodiphosphate synthase